MKNGYKINSIYNVLYIVISVFLFAILSLLLFSFHKPVIYDPLLANQALSQCFDEALQLRNQMEITSKEIMKYCTDYALEVARKNNE